MPKDARVVCLIVAVGAGRLPSAPQSAFPPEIGDLNLPEPNVVSDVVVLAGARGGISHIKVDGQELFLAEFQAAAQVPEHERLEAAMLRSLGDDTKALLWTWCCHS